MLFLEQNFYFQSNLSCELALLAAALHAHKDATPIQFAPKIKKMLRKILFPDMNYRSKQQHI